MNAITKILITISVFTIIAVMPVISFAVAYPDGPLIPCGTQTYPPGQTIPDPNNPGGTPIPVGGQVSNPCDFFGFMDLVNGIINFIIQNLAIPIAAIMFFYAGFLMVTAGGESAQAKTKAKEIFTNTVIGLAIAVGCWIIVKTILSILGYNGAWIGFPLP
jgi:hypothetical protein